MCYDQIKYQGAIEIAKALVYNNTLETIDISINQIGDHRAIKVTRALSINNTLCTPDLEYNQIGNQRSPKLNTLSLYNNQIEHECGNQIINVFKNNYRLTRLDLEISVITVINIRQNLEIIT